MARILTRLIDAQRPWAAPLGDALHGALAAVVRPIRPVKDLLHGTWLGHPLHAAATDIPIGALYVSVVLDLVGQPVGADVALVVAVLALLGSALSGLADYADTDGRARLRATVHAVLMVLTLVLVAVSLGLRATAGAVGDRTIPVALSVLAAILVTAGAYVGGDVVFALGNMVDRHAWRGAGAKWVPLEVAATTPDDLPEGSPVQAKAGPNALVLVRLGATVHALHDQCAHAGGPLSGGRLVDGCIECPWHGSRFHLADGRNARGPAVYDQPAYEVRWSDAGWEARRTGGPGS